MNYQTEKENAMKKWKCGGCGFIADGEDAPAKCPKCGAPQATNAAKR